MLVTSVSSERLGIGLHSASGLVRAVSGDAKLTPISVIERVLCFNGFLAEVYYHRVELEIEPLLE